VPRSFHDPKAAIAKEIHGLLKGTKPLPRTFELGTIFCFQFGIKELSMPLTILILEVTRTAVLKSTRPEQACGIREHFGDRSAMVPMSVAMFVTSVKMFNLFIGSINIYLKRTVLMSS